MSNKNDNNRNWVYVMGCYVGNNTRRSNTKCEKNDKVKFIETYRVDYVVKYPIGSTISVPQQDWKTPQFFTKYIIY